MAALRGFKPRYDMIKVPMYPLRFEPIYQCRLWGGRRLADLLMAPLPGDGPIGEAWLLSDRDDHPSKVASGPLKGLTVRQLMEKWPEQLLGKLTGRFQRFPVLLKFLDAHEKLSVQVHPKDGQKDYIPAGESGKTEAWVVLEANPTSRIYAGLKPGTTLNDLSRRSPVGRWRTYWQALRRGLATPSSFKPGPFTPSADLWCLKFRKTAMSRFACTTGIASTPKQAEPRPLQVQQALACIDFEQVAISPVAPVIEEEAPVRREQLFHCEHFSVWRHTGSSSFTVGAAGVPRVLIGIEGSGQVEHDGATYDVAKGDVLLLPAEVGACSYRPRNAVSLLEVALPE